MRRAVAPLLAVTVAVVLADSAVVTLALPAILRNLHTSVGQVAWVLISFNLVLGLVAVPVALLFTRARPRISCALGIAVFAGASAWCASATSIDVLIAARCVQALGGAAALIGCLELLVARYGERPGVAVWVTAGVVGTAFGPVAGGLLTQAFSWQAIFVVQVPIALMAVPAALSVPAVPALVADRHRPALRPNLTLALLSAALTAALFLLVLLLVEGWDRSPAVAALAVSVVPLAALAARPNVRYVGAVTTEQLGGHLATMDVGLTPYRESAFNRASFPLKTLEYLAAGIPAVSTVLPAAQWLREDLRRAGERTPDELLTVGTGAAEFAAAARRLAVAPPMADRCRAFAARHTWDRRAAAFATLLDAPLYRKARPVLEVP